MLNTDHIGAIEAGGLFLHSLVGSDRRNQITGLSGDFVERPIVLVTGCSSGIGQASIPHLVAAGAHVVATARRLESIASLEGPHVELATLDVTDAATRSACVDAILERHGRIDVLVNNAGFGAVAAFEDTTPELLDRIFATNLFGAHELTRLVLPHMRAQGTGRIVNVSSMSGHIPIPMQSAYCATKFAMRAMTQVLDVEVREFGIRATLVEPGFVNTPFGQRSHQETMENVADRDESPYARRYAVWAKRRSRPGHGASPDDIAKAITKAALSKRPRIHYFAPLHAKVYNLVKRLLPDSMLHWGLNRKFG